MEKQLEAVGVEYERELMLVPGRRFRFDFTFRSAGLVAEIEGGTWSGGRHTTGAGFRQDCVKYNLASLEGWTVMRFTSDMVSLGWHCSRSLLIWIRKRLRLLLMACRRFHGLHGV